MGQIFVAFSEYLNFKNIEKKPNKIILFCMVIGWQTVVISKTQYNVYNLRISFDVKDTKFKSNGIQKESNNFTFFEALRRFF